VGEARGQGAELRTDAAAALRAAKGILLTTYARNKAQGHQLDRDELNLLLSDCAELFKSLGEYAGAHGGEATDAAGQHALAEAFKGWQTGSSDERSSSRESPHALMAFGAQAGALHVTPKTHLTYAGENIDQVARQHVQVASGRKISLQAEQGLALFAQTDGLSAIANHGKVKVQSQADDTQIDSAKNIKITAAGGKLAGTASDEVVFVTSGGAYLKLHGENIELGCPGSFTVKSAVHHWDGPASMSADLPKFDAGSTGRVPQLIRASDGLPVGGYEGEVLKASGDLLEGQSDPQGKLSRIKGERFEPLVVNFFKNKK
jgi:uncharacterized protein (DUF2345 family)